MTREIKFRGKAADVEQPSSGKMHKAGEWVYGNLCGHPDRIEIEEVIRMSSKYWHIPSTIIDPNTVGQFTGLRDKNGKEIYEGDIIAVNGMQIGYIVGGVRGYCYDVIYTPAKTNGEKEWPLYSVVTRDYPNKCDVIGNIYDNPELLKQEG